MTVPKDRKLPEGMRRSPRAYAIPGAAVNAAGRVELGSLLADVGRQARLTDEEFAVFDQMRDKAPARPAPFE